MKMGHFSKGNSNRSTIIASQREKSSLPTILLTSFPARESTTSLLGRLWSTNNFEGARIQFDPQHRFFFQTLVFTIKYMVLSNILVGDKFSQVMVEDESKHGERKSRKRRCYKCIVRRKKWSEFLSPYGSEKNSQATFVTSKFVVLVAVSWGALETR